MLSLLFSGNFDTQLFRILLEYVSQNLNHVDDFHPFKCFDTRSSKTRLGIKITRKKRFPFPLINIVNVLHLTAPVCICTAVTSVGESNGFVIKIHLLMHMHVDCIVKMASSSCSGQSETVTQKLYYFQGPVCSLHTGF